MNLRDLFTPAQLEGLKDDPERLSAWQAEVHRRITAALDARETPPTEGLRFTRVVEVDAA